MTLGFRVYAVNAHSIIIGQPWGSKAIIGQPWGRCTNIKAITGQPIIIRLLLGGLGDGALT